MSKAGDVGVPGGGMRSTGPTPELWPPPESMRPTLIGERYMVSAGHPLVADVACRVFERGGNAIDAGVAAGLAANVVQADMCNLGGVAPLLVRTGDSDRVWSVGGLGGWGKEATLEAHLERFGGDIPAGSGCAVVPAAAAAWIAALRRFGNWDFASVAAAAIEYARDGFTLDRRTAESLEICGRTFAEWETSRAVFWPRGRAPRVGERIVQRDLGVLLETLVGAEREALNRGASRDDALVAVHRAFYEGETAERIVAFVRGGGGFMSLEDLAEFVAEVEPAVSAEYGGWTVSVNDTWTQGPALLQVLAILSGFELSRLEHNSAEYIHLLTEAIKLAFSDRERFYGDPRQVDVPLAWLTSDEHAAELSAMIDPASVLPNLPTVGASEPPSGPVRRRPDTTYLCTVDASGNAFSATISDTLDGCPLIPGLGIVASPRGVQSRLDPEHPAVLAPGKRPRLDARPRARPTPGCEWWPGARLALRLSRRRRDPAGHGAGIPQRRRIRDDAPAGGRGIAGRLLQLSRLVLSQCRGPGAGLRRGGDRRCRQVRACGARSPHLRLAGA